MLVTVLGITIIFFLPRLMPVGPVEGIITGVIARGEYLDPAAAEETVRILRELYGLEEGLLTQYVSFWGRLFTGDFGPSLVSFPVPVIQLIGRALPWTFGLLLTTTVLTFIIGNISGGLAGYFRRSRTLKIIDGMVMFVAPIPYYIVALMLIILFAYLFPIFPVGGGYTIGTALSLTWASVTDILRHAFLPAMSLILLGSAITHQIMRLIVQGVKDEDYIRYAKIGDVNERTIYTRYVMRNAMLPQITRFALGFAMLFSGALVTEMVFAYPGLGMLAYRAILASDYNLLMGITTLSIIALTTSTLLMDLLNPLFDPRIRFR
ncbi:Oligopeptide transport system permease protein OppB [subsurface metagenome]